MRKTKGSLYVTSNELRNNRVSLFLNSNELDAHMSRNNFSQDSTHSVYCNDTHQYSSFTLDLSKNRFESNQLHTVQITVNKITN